MFWAIGFYTKFLKEHPNYQVGLQGFEKIKPYYVRKLKAQNTCACKYHVEMAELRHGFNNMWYAIKGIHGWDCNYDCDICHGNLLGQCSVDHCQFFGLIDLWTSILYPLHDSQWHNSTCLTGTYVECGIDMLITCALEESRTCAKLVQCKCYELV